MIKPLKAKALSPQTLKRVGQFLSEARTLVSMDQLLQACDIYKSILQLDPNCLEALHVLASLHFHFKSFDSALTLLLRGIELTPKNTQIQLLTGKCARELKKFELAKSCLLACLALEPHQDEAHVELGLVYLAQGKLEESIQTLENALLYNSANYDALNNLGIALKEKGDFERALKAYDQAITLQATQPNAYANRGVLLHMLGRFDQALVDLDRAIELAPQSAANHLSKGQLLLTLGELTQGWSEFEWRWAYLRDNRVNTSWYHNYPLWSGRESLMGKSILLYAEQGLGDTLQFCRYASLVAQLGARVILECEAPLYELLRTLEGVEHLIIQGGQGALPQFDFQCPLMSLPMVFRTTLESVPNNVPYLSASADKVHFWSEKLKPDIGSTPVRRPRVGLVWSGGFRADQPELWAVNKRRNVSLSALAPFADVPVDFYSLQKGAPAETELKDLISMQWSGPQIRNYSADLKDFSDTAALIANLDLIISVDTSTAHLAAAMGKPTWILNRYDTCWRWLLNRADSLWYPSVKLYRQTKIGQWDDVIDAVKNDLLQFYCS
jgi:hypothetical protein